MAALESFDFPLLVREMDGPVMTASSISTKVGDMHFGPHDTHLDEEISLRIRAGADSTFEIHA